ncbi:prepilin-type N-terminal cleavage/methylation domain-containing protein [Bradyrhizobium sp. AUGA SZCCT0274]|nr:prepilin-type N-terminal cleavage/methylation domain-containing protein [Bradyrhizobium sp. AUGA SZCCT0274]
MIARHDPSDEAGFTLVELLVGLALFSLLVTLLFGNIRFGLHAWQKGGANAELFERSMISQDLLRRMIGNLYPMSLGGGAVQSRIDFDGTKEAISFLGNAPTVASGGGRYRFKIVIERRQDQSDLVLTSRPELADPQDTSMAASTLLLQGIERAEFSYFGEAGSERSLQWNDNWANRGDIPKLVRVRVAFRSGNTRVWPELVIAPRVLADVGCIYDPISMRCRGR